MADNENNGLILKWFDACDERKNGENSILVYPDLQSFRQIYTRYIQGQLAAEKEEEEENSDNTRSKQSKSRIILIAPFYETVDSVKHNLSAEGSVDVNRHIKNGSLVIVDALSYYFPDIDGMKKLVASLSDRAKKEGRAGITAIIDMGFFFLFGGDGAATQLIKYEAALPPKIDGGNVRRLSCYHVGNYNTLNDSQKLELIAQGQKKLLEIKERAA